MKKWYFILAVFLLAIILGVVLPVVRGAVVKTFYNDVAVHSASHDVYKDTKGVTVDGSVRMSDANVYYFIKAITRTGLGYLLFKPNTAEMPFVSVTFHDGAEIRVFDAGQTRQNKDLAYVVYSYNGDHKYFKLVGFDTYERVSMCAGKEGFSGENIPIQ